MTKETTVNAFQLVRPRGKDLPVTPVTPVKQKAAPGTTRVMDVNGRFGPKLAPNGSQGFAIEPCGLTPAERAANRALAESRADLASQLSRAGVRYPIPAPKAKKAAGKKNPAGVVAPRRTFVNQPSNESLMSSKPKDPTENSLITGANYMANASATQVPMFSGDVAPAQKSTQKTSIELLELVNQIRAEFGESQVRHGDFVARSKDELDGEYYETFVVKNQRGPATEAIRMTIDQCKLVAMRESKGVRRKVLARLNDLEQKLAQPTQPPVALPDFTNPAIAARAWAEQFEAKAQAQQQLAIAAPKAQALDRIAQAEGDMCITSAAKSLGMQPKRLFSWMQENNWIYRRPSSAAWLAYQARIKSGVLEHKVTTVSRADGREKVVEQVLVTPKGLAKLAEVAA